MFRSWYRICTDSSINSFSYCERERIRNEAQLNNQRNKLKCILDCICNNWYIENLFALLFDDLFDLNIWPWSLGSLESFNYSSMVIDSIYICNFLYFLKWKYSLNFHDIFAFPTFRYSWDDCIRIKNGARHCSLGR